MLEALAAECAVIVPQGAPFDEYLDERCASIVDPQSAPQIALALSRLLSDESERKRFAKSGYERVQRYSWRARGRATPCQLRVVAGAGPTAPFSDSSVEFKSKQ